MLIIACERDLAGSIAHRHGMKLAALKALNPGVNLDRLQIDDKIRIKATDAGKPKLTVIVRDQSEQTERVPAPVREVSSAQIIEGKQTVVTPGRDGVRKIKIATIGQNGTKTGSRVLATK